MKDHSPCYDCEFINDNKKNDRCEKCKKRIAYAQRMSLISSENADNIETERKNLGISNEVIEGTVMTFHELDVECIKTLKDIKDLEKVLKDPKETFPKQKGSVKGRKPNKVDSSLKMKSQIYIRFSIKHSYIHQELLSIAKAENRTMSMQAIQFIKQGIDKYREDHNE